MLVLQVEKASDTSKINQDPFFQRKMHEPITSKGFRKPAPSVQNNDHRICRGLPAGPAVAHVKPSGLRLPMPTMGFFSQVRFLICFVMYCNQSHVLLASLRVSKYFASKY